jgi:uncharacterized Tic20 family protein
MFSEVIMNNTAPTRDERTMAALAHGSVILFGMGIIAAVAIWITQKDKSRYVAYQALQALVYQFAGLVVAMIGWCCWLALYFASFIPLMFTVEQGGNDPGWLIIFATLLMFIPLALMGLWTLGGLWGAVRTLQGRDFRYLVIGQQLERWLDAN